MSCLESQNTMMIRAERLSMDPGIATVVSAQAAILRPGRDRPKHPAFGGVAVKCKDASGFFHCVLLRFLKYHSAACFKPAFTLNSGA